MTDITGAASTRSHPESNVDEAAACNDPPPVDLLTPAEREMREANTGYGKWESHSTRGEVIGLLDALQAAREENDDLREIVRRFVNADWTAVRELIGLRDVARAALPQAEGRGECHGHRDGDCIWEHCPQLRDGEPMKTGRHCPIDKDDPNR